MTMPVLLPQLPFGTGPVTIVAWLRQPGDRLSAGQPLVIVANERVEVALPAPGAGTLGEIAAPTGTQLATGGILAHINPQRRTAPPQRATPLARRIAAELGIELAGVTGSAPGGRIVGRDVHQAAKPHSLPAAQVVSGPSNARPICWSVMEARVGNPPTRLAAYPRPAGRDHAAPLLARVVAATIATLLHQPRAHAYWHDEGLAIARHLWLDVQFADRQRVLLGHAEEFNLCGVARALANHSATSTTRAPVFTISETTGCLRVGHNGVAVPQLVLGPIAAHALAMADSVSEHVVVAQLCTLAFAYDARVLTYAEADRFLATIVQRLERA